MFSGLSLSIGSSGVVIPEGELRRDRIHNAVAAFAATNPGTVVFNTQQQLPKDPTHANAVDVAKVFEEQNVVYAGVAPSYLEHNAENIKMLGFYGEISVVPFHVFASGSVAESTPIELPKGITFPVSLRSVQSPLYQPIVRQDGVAAGEFDAAMRAALKLCPRILVEEYHPTWQIVHAFAYGNTLNPEIKKKTAVAVGPLNHPQLTRLEEVGRVVLETFAGGTGWVLATVLISEKDEVFLHEVDFNCSLAEDSPAMLLLSARNAVETFLKDHTEYSKRLHNMKQPSYVVSFDSNEKGYFVRAARDIPKGAVVFDDEGRSFTITTRKWVEEAWSEADKVVFSRFGWPLDEEGHVYVTWEESPKRWRPINHSCDPNLIFRDGHGLNQIAARDIKKGEDLTLDYAMFCDFTMKPFQCFCGSPMCRGMIQPNAEALAKYGTNAWHRRMPN